ncbi:MAG TPA: response regulator transcription factor [Mycobacteriales bacterium]|nr:response regulator transcription factor [Mycobacteriales bacterium]HWB66409.1 response regulator transcription factor [Mycobacteriales bacterium]
MTIRVLIADDQPLMRTGFRMILHATDDIRVVGEASDGSAAATAAAELEPDVVLMDVRMPGTDGIEGTRRIVAEVPGSRVLILTTFDLDEYAFTALRAGASGFLLKDVPPDQLVEAIRAVASGDAVVSPRVTRQLLDRYAPSLPAGADGGPMVHPLLAKLTDREGEVLLALARGLSNAEIADLLVLSEKTVKTHVTRILAKLGLRDRVQAVVLAYEQRLVLPGMQEG